VALRQYALLYSPFQIVEEGWHSCFWVEHHTVRIPIIHSCQARDCTFRFESVLAVAYSTRDYWHFGNCPSSGILKHNVSETASVSFLSWGDARKVLWSLVQWLRLAFSNGTKRVGVLHPLTWEWKQIQFPKRSVYYNTGRWAKSKNPAIPADCSLFRTWFWSANSLFRSFLLNFLFVTEKFRTHFRQSLAVLTLPLSVSLSTQIW
jgi:hypothetical protein